jgi:hypothetical protein
MAKRISVANIAIALLKTANKTSVSLGDDVIKILVAEDDRNF